ncbi:uncharacterized protein IL334_007780 [Kwoniella shivajii]|uniref:Protein kinase domain-containing protein n=1 Tax=Kwoniella shivajii TaxID=564305 RepID=A0ABZ1D9L8_9TREE|nr:hypothetical protein IL334_007780 [Kwoniella shivajii]
MSRPPTSPITISSTNVSSSPWLRSNRTSSSGEPSSPSTSRPSRPQLRINGVISNEDIAESPLENSASDDLDTPTRLNQSLSYQMPSTRAAPRLSLGLPTDALDDPLGYSVEKAERSINGLHVISSALEFTGTLLSAVPLLQTGGAIMVCLSQMLNAARKVMENKSDALGLVSDSITIVQAVQRQIQSSATPPSEQMRSDIVKLYRKLTSNTDLLEEFVGRSKFKLFLYAAQMQRQIATARSDTVMYIASFMLEHLVSMNQLQEQARIDRQRDREEFAKKLDQFIRFPERARQMIENEEIPEIVMTLQRTVEEQYDDPYRYPPVNPHSQAILQFPTPQPYYPSVVTTGTAASDENPLQLLVDGNNLNEDQGLPPAHIPMPEVERSTTRQSRRAWQVTSEDWTIEDSRGAFCRNFLKYLRTESQRSIEDLPVWTITEYEIYREERITDSHFARVYRGRWNDQEVAIKSLAPLTDKYLFLAEVKIWCQLDSEFILPFLGASSSVGPAPWFLVSPWMKNGRITDYLSRGAGQQVDPLPLIHRIAQGMEYLHSRDIIHGDLKGQNILIDDEGLPRLCDFGLSRIKLDITSKSSISSSGSVAGTLRFEPPERLRLYPLSKECDVYSFAMTIFQIYSGETPFIALDDTTTKASILAGERPPQIPGISNELYALMSRC